MPQTILFQPPNHIGLGHISRLLAIALEVRRAAPDTRTPFIVEGDGHGLIAAHGLPEINLPGSVDLYETQKWSGWDRAARHLLVLDLATALLRGLAPQVIVFDCFPNVAVANAAMELGVPAAVCLRKTKQMPLFFDRIRQLSSAVQLIVVPHEESECPVPDDLRSRTCFAGSIVRPAPEEPSGRAPGWERRPGSRLIVISAGGGGYPGVADFYNLATDAFARVRAARPEVEALLVAGPLFQAWWELRLTDGLRVIPFEPRLSRLFAASDLVICQAGYNTAAEIAALGVPAIMAPAERHSDDQWERARALARGSDVLRVHDGTDASALAALMIDALDRGPRAARSTLATEGAARAAASLLALAARASAAVR